MPIPLKNKLSSIWARATHKDWLYSRTFESKSSSQYETTRVYGGVAAGPLYTQTVPYNSYIYAEAHLVAQPIKGDAGNYRMYKYTDNYYSNDADTGLAPRLSSPSPEHFVDNIGSVYTKDQALQLIKAQEETWLKAGALPLQKQPRAYRKQPRLKQ